MLFRSVPAGEAAPLAQAIARLLDDGPLRARLGTAAAQLARSRFSGACVARRLVDVYTSLQNGASLQNRRRP